jgi:hypothetical protein
MNNSGLPEPVGPENLDPELTTQRQIEETRK